MSEIMMTGEERKLFLSGREPVLSATYFNDYRDEIIYIEIITLVKTKILIYMNSKYNKNHEDKEAA